MCEDICLAPKPVPETYLIAMSEALMLILHIMHTEISPWISTDSCSALPFLRAVDRHPETLKSEWKWKVVGRCGMRAEEREVGFGVQSDCKEKWANVNGVNIRKKQQKLLWHHKTYQIYRAEPLIRFIGMNQCPFTGGSDFTSSSMMKHAFSSVGISIQYSLASIFFFALLLAE